MLRSVTLNHARRLAALVLGSAASWPCAPLLHPALAAETAAAPRPAPADTAPADTTRADTGQQVTLLLLLGAGGEGDYAAQFKEWAGAWQQAARGVGAELITVGAAGDALGVGDSKPGDGPTDREQLLESLSSLAAPSTDPLWLVLIGHGTFDGRTARFNLRGPDISAEQLAEALAPLERPLVVVNCASSSGPFINALSAPGRVVVTATKSGHEHNFARFGQYLAAAVVDPAADLDKDGQTSLLEAVLTAAAQVREFYASQGRLATEFALVDDNGDALGTSAEWFRGIRATRSARQGQPLDGPRAHQFHLAPSEAERHMPAQVRQRRDALELEIARWREQKGSLDEQAYYERLEALLVELARLYAEHAPGE